jgi:uncharacterized protein YdeI (YjbR/CyaY-like superfamily)
MMSMNPKVDFFFAKPSQWQEAYGLLRNIVLDCGLTEELKWGCPCYTLNGKNVVLIHGFKSYCALLFMKGALLQDAQGILIQQTENVQSARQIRFANAGEINKLSAVLKAYIHEAIAVEKAGAQILPEAKKELQLADEFQQRLREHPALKVAFEALTPGRQRAYNLYFSAPKQSKTRLSRIEKYEQQILNGKGLED